jgi:hypothetical protein
MSQQQILQAALKSKANCVDTAMQALTISLPLCAIFIGLFGCVLNH